MKLIILCNSRAMIPYLYRKFVNYYYYYISKKLNTSNEYDLLRYYLYAKCCGEVLEM